MLRFLGVRRLAVIDELEVEFEPGLNILTGETGAGKSVLIEAIDLLVGGRASADLVRTGEDTATIQAVFERADGREVIVRREISAQGRSRAFIDDALATSGALKDLGASLIDLHGQHEHQSLLDPSDHITHLDTYVSDAESAAAVASAHAAWRTALTAAQRSQLDDREKRARIEIATFQLQDIQKVAPEPGEDERLAAERTVLANVDRLSRWSQEAYAALYDGDASALAALSTVWKRVADLATLDPRFAAHLQERDAVKAALEDLAFVLRSYASELDTSPNRLQTIEDRLAALDRLKKKYGPTLTEVIERQRALDEDLSALGATEQRAERLAAEEQSARQLFLAAAKSRSAQRRKAAAVLSRALERALEDLAMPHARVDVRVTALTEEQDWTARGTDLVEFFLSPNPGEEVRPLARIASGGELSRVMLALRTLAEVGEPGRTLVFDEVDAGIGGAAADAVGARLQQLAERDQVLCITHLPQVAARRGAHFHLSKRIAGGRTATGISRLDGKGRELEIARMIAGADISEHVVRSAREMLVAKGESEVKSKGEGSRAAKAKGKRA